MSNFTKLQSQHEALLDSIERQELDVDAVISYIQYVIQSSDQISLPRERDQLRSLLRFWASYAYDRTGKYPNTQLLPTFEMQPIDSYPKAVSLHWISRSLGFGSIIIFLLAASVVLATYYNIAYVASTPNTGSLDYISTRTITPSSLPQIMAIDTPSPIPLPTQTLITNGAVGAVTALPTAREGVTSVNRTSVQCGQIIESEFTKNQEQQVYTLAMNARDSFSVSLEPVGDFLKMGIGIYGPTGLPLGSTGSTPLTAPKIESGMLSTHGDYGIRVANTGINNGTLSTSSGGVGSFVMHVSCISRDGVVINSGYIPQPTSTKVRLPTPTLARLPILTSTKVRLPTPTPRSTIPDSDPSFTGTGFPGLAPVDFADAVTIPLRLDEKMTGVLPTGNEILGFTLDATAGDTLDLSYTRAAGNMNLGLVVLSAENEVFFQASLVTSESLATTFTLPTVGAYTLGVFRISLVEPEEVQPTVFQLQGSLVAAE